MLENKAEDCFQLTRDELAAFASCVFAMAMELFLIGGSFVAGVMLILTPTLLRNHTPPFAKPFTTAPWNWEIGLFVLGMVALHLAGVLMGKCKTDFYHQLTPRCCERHRRGVYFRIISASVEFVVWLFLTVAYGFLFWQFGDITLASGLCVLFLTACGCAIMHLSKVAARLKVKKEFSDKRDAAGIATPDRMSRSCI